MNFRLQKRVQIDDSQPPKFDQIEADDGAGEVGGEEHNLRLLRSRNNVTEDQEPFMGVKVRRKASLHRDYRGDYVDVPSSPYLMKILEKQG